MVAGDMGIPFLNPRWGEQDSLMILWALCLAPGGWWSNSAWGNHGENSEENSICIWCWSIIFFFSKKGWERTFQRREQHIQRHWGVEVFLRTETSSYNTKLWPGWLQIQTSCSWPYLSIRIIWGALQITQSSFSESESHSVMSTIQSMEFSKPEYWSG